MKIIIFVLLLVILGLIYCLGLIPKTPLFYEKRFNEFYLGLLSATSCDDVLFWLDYQEDPGFVKYIQNNDIYIQKKYPRDLLANHVNPMNCIDKYGNKVVF
jgi:hypothetical protein